MMMERLRAEAETRRQAERHRIDEQQKMQQSMLRDKNEVFLMVMLMVGLIGTRLRSSWLRSRRKLRRSRAHRRCFRAGWRKSASCARRLSSAYESKSISWARSADADRRFSCTSVSCALNPQARRRPKTEDAAIAR